MAVREAAAVRGLAGLVLVLGVVLGPGCASSPDAACVRACDVDWEGCRMTCERDLERCQARCTDRSACLERCEAAYPIERARCDERHRGCLSGCND